MRCQHCLHPMLLSDKTCPRCHRKQPEDRPGILVMQGIAYILLFLALILVIQVVWGRQWECNNICSDLECDNTCMRIGPTNTLKLKNLPTVKP